MKEEMKSQFGFIDLIDQMGNSTSVVNAARVSFGKRHKGPLTEQDKRLIKYLWNHKHTSPFRHVMFSFHIAAPIFILRQWMKHQVGSTFNEMSGRYVEFKNSFHCPDKFREAPKESIKQGSGDILDLDTQDRAYKAFQFSVNMSHEVYKNLLEMGVCKEQARGVLPLSLFTECIWTVSLQALIHFLNLRLAKDAQTEIRYYAEAIKEILEKDEDMKFILGVCLDDNK
jgi:thymidylate synthase (FAD)